MRRFQRGVEPAFLAANWEAWGREWEQRRAANASARFHWHTVDKEPVHQRLLPLLKAQTQDHCSFCDNFPVSPPSLETVEHFRPKSTFPREAYRWGNLYYCCMHCQQKGDAFDEDLLRPDADDYAFDRYFRWDYTRGTLEPNEQATEHDRHRARITIRFYRLNEGHPAHRKWSLRNWSRSKEEPLDAFPYRDYLDNPQPVGPPTTD